MVTALSSDAKVQATHGLDGVTRTPDMQLYMTSRRPESNENCLPGKLQVGADALMQAAVMPHSLPEPRDVQEEGSEVFVHNFKDIARVFLEQPVVMRQEWKVHMSHYEFVSRRLRALLAHI